MGSGCSEGGGVGEEDEEEGRGGDIFHFHFTLGLESGSARARKPEFGPGFCLALEPGFCLAPTSPKPEVLSPKSGNFQISDPLGAERG